MLEGTEFKAWLCECFRRVGRDNLRSSFEVREREADSNLLEDAIGFNTRHKLGRDSSVAGSRIVDTAWREGLGLAVLVGVAARPERGNCTVLGRGPGDVEDVKAAASCTASFPVDDVPVSDCYRGSGCEEGGYGR